MIIGDFLHPHLDCVNDEMTVAIFHVHKECHVSITVANTIITKNNRSQKPQNQHKKEKWL